MRRLILSVGFCCALTGTLRGAEAKPAPGVPVEVHFLDGSIVRLQLLDDKLTFNTDYGKLTVPVAALRQVEFASRVPDDVQTKIDAALAKLASKEFKERSKAANDLLELGVQAYPALLAATKSNDMEVSRRARQLVAKIKEGMPGGTPLKPRTHDILHTADSHIAGKFEATVLKARTSQFGDVQMKLADIRSLRRADVPAPAKALTALPDPGSLADHVNQPQQFGARLAFTVTGNTTGAVWGSDVYTLDSTLATAAVHAGVLKNGQTGVVTVEIVAPPASFNGTTQNGVTSFPWGAYPGAFRFTK